MWHMTTHDTTWHDTANMGWLDDVAMSSRYRCWVIDVFLDMLSLLLCIARCCSVFNDLWSWKVVAHLFSFCFLLVGPLVRSTTSESLGMLSSFSSFFILSWLDSVPILAIHSWRDDINLKTRYPKMMHYYPMSLGQVKGWEREPSNYALRSSRWGRESMIIEVVQSTAQA